MHARLFEDLVVSRPAGHKTRAGGIPLSLIVHGAALAGLLLVSAIVPDDLPVTTGTIVFPGGLVAPKPLACVGLATRGLVAPTLA